jgi:hypothetical protein
VPVVYAAPDEHEEAAAAERREADLIARAVARSKPLSAEDRRQIVSLLARPRRQGAA